MNTRSENPVNETLLLVDDEPELIDMLDEYFRKQGYQVRSATNANAARQIIEREKIHLMVLDINMPGESGLDLLRDIRGRTRLPVILLTANSDLIDRVVGLELGADDYLGKPFDLRELLARIRSVLRRTAPGESVSSSPRMRFGNCELDLEGRKLFRDNGEEVPITAMEFDLLHAFAMNPNRVLSRDRLLELAHCRGWDPFDRSIDIRITRLRRKIETDPAHPQIIKTVRGAGYLFAKNPKLEIS